MEKRKQDALASLAKRCTNETPPFFKKLRTAGLVLAAIGTTIVSAPIALPAMAVTIGGYVLLGGTVITAVSQTAVGEMDCEEEEK
ncbi:hypothetical protein [Brumimicrobium aurantiacum]|uniref:Uncharacterized protein n=1 Tax=Brumimicrobium aurantiacum TaxID=1737063 RepID=A0A3E1EU77_9FLAO|nr:hypothetical protein [Brumimicrobium aurantiacum]RFC53104.1 hypothetical protein DXU93_14800 [Brumimicrobium aurantiacum]